MVFLGPLVFVMQIDVGQGILGRNTYDTRNRSMLGHILASYNLVKFPRGNPFCISKTL